MTRTELAALLKTSNLDLRLVGMKLGPTCGRCLGSGQYSFNGTHSRCYGCNGNGVILPRASEWEETCERAKAAVSNGDLDRYLASLEARARCKNGMKRALAAWTLMDIANGYSKNWNRLKTLPNAERVIARNNVGNDLCKALQALDKGVTTDWIEYDRVLTEGLARLAEITEELKKDVAA